jgi:hypothetical protein
MWTLVHVTVFSFILHRTVLNSKGGMGDLIKGVVATSLGCTPCMMVMMAPFQMHQLRLEIDWEAANPNSWVKFDESQFPGRPDSNAISLCIATLMLATKAKMEGKDLTRARWGRMGIEVVRVRLWDRILCVCERTRAKRAHASEASACERSERMRAKRAHASEASSKKRLRASEAIVKKVLLASEAIVKKVLLLVPADRVLLRPVVPRRAKRARRRCCCCSHKKGAAAARRSWARAQTVLLLRDHGFLTLRSRSRRSPRYAFIALYFVVLAAVMQMGDPSAVKATGLHQTIGDCDVKGWDLSGYERRQYVRAVRAKRAQRELVPGLARTPRTSLAAGEVAHVANTLGCSWAPQLTAPCCSLRS